MSNTFTEGKALALFQEKCPRCQTGKMFKYPATNLGKFTDMNEKCSNCNLHFEIEPGFYWGAMYVSYAITTGMMLVLGTLTYLIGKNPDFWIYITVICGSIILSAPLVYRYSRVLMLYFFSPIRFDKKHVHSK